MKPKVELLTNERVPLARRTEALRKLNEWGLERAKDAVRKNYPAGLSEDTVDLFARVIIDRLARENFERSKAGHQT